MSRNPPQQEERCAGSGTDFDFGPDYEYARQSDLTDCYVSAWESAMIRFAISCSLLVGVGIAGFHFGMSTELAMIWAALGAAIVMVHKGEVEDPTA